MNTRRELLMCVLVLGLLKAGNLSAIDFGQDITIPDNDSMGTSGWWGPQEDDEIEPLVYTFDQPFDMEGFISDEATLTVVGGYNFWKPPQSDMDPGDIFIDVTGMGQPVVYGQPVGGAGESNGETPEPNIWGYDYVYDLAFNSVNNTYSYTLYAIGENALLMDVLYDEHTRANPWRYSSGGTPIGSSGTLNMLALSDNDLIGYGYGSYDANMNDLDHYAVQVDLTQLGLPGGSEFTAHFTMECGNDNLMGRGLTRIPDGGVTLTLLGTALMGMAIVRARFIN